MTDGALGLVYSSQQIVRKLLVTKHETLPNQQFGHKFRYSQNSIDLYKVWTGTLLPVVWAGYDVFELAQWLGVSVGGKTVQLREAGNEGLGCTAQVMRGSK